MNDGGPAFPRPGIPTNWKPHAQEGMSLRDWFAGQALTGWLASYGSDTQHPARGDTADSVAADAYAMADAMLKARNEKSGGPSTATPL